jgi:hypothetical protein
VPKTKVERVKLVEITEARKIDSRAEDGDNSMLQQKKTVNSIENPPACLGDLTGGKSRDGQFFLTGEKI